MSSSHSGRSSNEPAIRGARSALEERAVAAAIAIPPVVVQSKGHGHAGTAMAMAPVAHVLFQRVLRHNPEDPQWEGRDRFILSAGHASLLLYTQLHLCGYGLDLGEIAASRTLDARTPGHPELGVTPGVEMSTGPLGQGLASAVGLALALRRDSALHDAGAGVWDGTVYTLAGDGCVQEGVSGEASSLAGTLGVDNLVVIWDDNRITIDGPTDIAFAEDVRARYASYGWRVLEIDDFRDLVAIQATLEAARERTGRPTLVAVRSVIGAPSRAVGGTSAAHAGAFGADEVAAVLQTLGFQAECALDDLVDESVHSYTRLAVDRGRAMQREWESRRAAWASLHPELAQRRDSLRRSFPTPGSDATELDPRIRSALDAVRVPAEGEQMATRTTNGHVITALHDSGAVWGGSADLSESTNVAVSGAAVSRSNPGGDFIPFGVREHAMAAILTGIALHGLWRPYGSTYLAFSDYQRPSIRLAALMGLPTTYVYTHDSVAVGEDGPTHQPVEQIASLRTVPGLAVVRPADAAEVVASWRALLAADPSPVALILSRQKLPVLPRNPGLDEGVKNGGYVAWEHDAGRDVALIATGSEVEVALAAARTLADRGVSVRVVSMPCVEWFEQADEQWREQVLPAAVTARVAVEAGRSDAWHRWVGATGRVVGIDSFGESGAGDAVLQRRGITADAVVRAAEEQLDAARTAAATVG